MKKPNLSKIGKWMNDNKCFIIGAIGVFVAEAGFLAHGAKEGYDKGANHGADYVLGKAKSMDDGTFEKLKDEMVKDGCKFYD